MNPGSSWPSALKRTRQRLIVLELLEQARQPLTAASLYEKAAADCRKLAFSTVYRILEAFVVHGLAERINVSHEEAALYERKRIKHRHYARCVECERLIPIDDCPLERIQAVLSDFMILEHHLELSGLCTDCAQKEKRPD